MNRAQVWLLQPDAAGEARAIAACAGVFLNLDPAQLDLRRDAGGRPWLAHAGRSLNTAVSWSRCHGLTACAFAAHGRIGIDVAVLSDDLDVAALARDHCTPDERTALAALPVAARGAAFLHIWTAKEATLKALGTGIGFGLDQIEIALTADTISVRRIAGSERLAAGWCVQHWRDGHAIVSLVCAAPCAAAIISRCAVAA